MSDPRDDQEAVERAPAVPGRGAASGDPGRSGDLLSLTLMLCYLMATLILALMAVVSTELQQEFGLSASQIGLLTSVFMFTYGAMGIPAGSAAARWGGRVLAVSCALIVLGSLVFALSSSYAGFLVGRILQGLGGGMVLPVSSPVIARALAPDMRARGWGIFASGKGLGVLVGLLAMPGVAALGGFRAVFLVTAGLAVVIGAIAFSQKPVRELPAESSEATSLRAQSRMLGATLANYRVWLLGLFNASSIAIGTAVMVWTPDFLIAEHGSSVGVAAYLTAGLAVAQLVGAPAGAGGAARLGRMVVITGSMFAMSAAAVLIPVVPGRALVFVMVALVGFFSFAYFSPRFAMIPEVVARPEHVGPATGLGNLLGYGISTLAPWLFGVVLDRGLGYFAAYLVLAVFGLAGVVGSFFMRVSNKPSTASALSPRSP
jgi:MFS family permease